MTRPELRVFLSGWFCGCGSPELAAERLRDLLALHPLFDHRAPFDEMVPDEGVQYLVLYALDHFKLTEHGGSVGGGWLTPKGEDVLAALRAEGDDLGTLMEPSCIHGMSLEGACTECGNGPKL